MFGNKRIKILTGHFGSGKTELSINLALREKESFDNVALNDLDVINPYFRSRDVRDLLRQSGIDCIAPEERLSKTDLPIVSGDLYRVLSDPSYRVIIDTGGDKDGATALGQYYHELKEQEYDFIFVVNASRPYVSTAEGIVETVRKIELASRLKVTGLVNNTNLGGNDTTHDLIDRGSKVTEQAASLLNIPVLFTSADIALEEQLNLFALDHNVFYLQRFMKTPWE